LSEWQGLTVVTMNRKVLTRLRVLVDAADGRLFRRECRQS
jgi:hypothetical protein